MKIPWILASSSSLASSTQCSTLLNSYDRSSGCRQSPGVWWPLPAKGQNPGSAWADSMGGEWGWGGTWLRARRPGVTWHGPTHLDKGVEDQLLGRHGVSFCARAENRRLGGSGLSMSSLRTPCYVPVFRCRADYAAPRLSADDVTEAPLNAIASPFPISTLGVGGNSGLGLLPRITQCLSPFLDMAPISASTPANLVCAWR
jgi:hypothetical protein